VKKLYDGDLSGLNLPKDLPVLMDAAKLGLADNTDLTKLYSKLAEDHPMALCELCVGPRAMRGEIAVKHALKFADSLEGSMQPKALYRRLVELSINTDGLPSVETALMVLNTATKRHPGASWVLPLCEKFEEIPGEAHLRNSLESGAFEAVCWAHAKAGHKKALHQLAREGHIECAAAILSTGDDKLALQAAGAAIDHSWETPVVPWFTAVAGPKADQLLVKLIPYIRSGQAARAIHAQSEPLRNTHALLSKVLPGLK
jgi:hypothetical protein